MIPRARGAATALAGLALGAAIAAAGCGTLRSMVSKPPEGKPSGRAGWLVYEVGGLRFEAPEAWRASGGGGRIRLDAPDGEARLDAWVVEERFADQRACLAAAGEALRKGEADLERPRTHETTLAGRPAVGQEGDASGWHGWRYGLCDGATQYRVLFAGRSPLPASVLEAYRALVASVRVGGEA